MAHMIDMTNGRANMAYIGERPWHGLGTVLTAGASLEEWTKAAGLGWSALKLPSFYQDNRPSKFTITANGMEPVENDKPAWIQSADNFHIVRDDTYESLGVMTGRYQPVQPREVMEFFEHFILTDDRFTLETAGSLKAGKVIWALAKFTEAMECGGDKHVPYVLLTTSYNGTLATTAQATMIRVVCNNTLTASVFDKGAATVKVPHSRVWTREVAADAHERLATISESFEVYKAMADAFRGIKMAKDQTEAFLKSLVLKSAAVTRDGPKVDGNDSGKAREQYNSLFQAWATTALETESNTAWAALNAVTRFADHDRNTRRSSGGISTDDARMASSFFGSGAALKATAVGALAEIGGVDLKGLSQRAHEDA